MEDLGKYFYSWLVDDVKPFLENQSLPDLWQQLEQQKPLVTGEQITDDETQPFSEEQKKLIRMSINEFRVVITKEFQPSKDEMKVIEDRLNYLSESLDRLNRFDWKSVAISTVMSISITLSLDTEKGNQLRASFKQIFTQAVNLLR